MKRKTFAPLDAVLAVFIVLFCILFWVFSFCFNDSGKKVTVSVDNEVVLTLSLNKDATEKIETEYGSNTVTVKNGSCYITDADCKDKICEKHSAISKKGETIVCLPHRLIAEVE